MNTASSSAVKVYASATVANVACGFDILGFAVERPGDEVIARLSDTPGVQLIRLEGDDGKLPRDVKKNTATYAVQLLLDHLGSKEGIEIELDKKMPLGSGLGSSAASAAAGLVAANVLLESPFTPAELVQFAMESERIACGSAHADNVAPALIGGFTLIRSTEPLDIIPLPVPEDLYCTVVHPHIEVRTEDARKILRREISLENATKQWGNIAGLVAGLFRADYELISRSLQDVIVEPTRSLLIPNFPEIKKSALSVGALGCSISGSGPSIFALSRGEEIARKAGSVMQEGFTYLDVKSDIYVSPVSSSGPRVERFDEGCAE